MEVLYHVFGLKQLQLQTSRRQNNFANMHNYLIPKNNFGLPLS